MTDKVQKIRKEVARIQLYTQSDVLKEVLDYIDKVQEEPVKIKKGCKYRCLSDMVNRDTGNISFIGDKIYLAPEDDTLVSEENGWLCDTSENASNFELVEEPVSEEWIEELRTKLDSLSKEDFKKVFDKYAIDFNEEPVSEDLEKIVEEIAEPTILNAYGTKELARRLRNTICGTSVSDELEKAANEIVNKAIPPLAVKYKDGTYVGKIMDCFDRKEFIDLVKAGAKWQKEQMMANAIDGKIYETQARSKLKASTTGNLSRLDYMVGDKVKVIVIKED